METKSERAARKRDQSTQERASASLKVGRTARTFVHAVHPDTGTDVVFLPGELLPEWVDLDRADEAL
jgi:hypothetical protein